jgi:hypothetical protein
MMMMMIVVRYLPLVKTVLLPEHQGSGEDLRDRVSL